MALEAQVAGFAKVCKIDPKVEEWLVKEGITDCEGVASLAAKKKMVDPKFIRMMIVEGIRKVKGSGKLIALKKFWRTWFTWALREANSFIVLLVVALLAANSLIVLWLVAWACSRFISGKRGHDSWQTRP